MYRNNWESKLSALKDKHNEIKEKLNGKKVAYIDIPFHFNVGDHLIYMGTERFLSESQVDVIYRAFATNINNKKLEEADVILFHGGGNFGDIYPLHQKLREKIVNDFKNKIIICLPQTIHFNSDEEKDRSARVFREHSNFYFYVRDHKSLNIAKCFTEHAKLMPDMAHSLHPLIDKSEVVDVNVKSEKVLNLKRVDVEKVEGTRSINKRSFDWCDILNATDHYIFSFLNVIQNVPFLKEKSNMQWGNYSKELCFRSTSYFLFHDVVYTDRLHGFILAFLLGRKIKLYDNSYGKNKAYYDAWFEKIDLIDWC